LFGFFKKLIHKDNIEFMKHTKNYLGASMIKNLLLVLSIPLFTRWLAKEEYGILSIFTSLVTLMTIGFGLNLRGGIIRYYFENEDDFDAALGSNLIFISVFNFFLLIFLFLVNNQLADFFTIDRRVFFLAVVAALFSVPLEIYLRYLQGSKQSKKFFHVSVVRIAGVLAVAIGIMYYLSKERYYGKIFGELAVTGLLAVYAIYKMTKLAKFAFDWKYIRYTLRFSLPLIPHAMSRYILGYFDRIIINQLGTAVETGIYSFAYDVGMAMNVIVMATIKAWHPIFFEEYNNKNYEKIDRMVKDYAQKIYFFAVVIILFAKETTLIIADRKYYDALEIIPVIVLGYVFVFLYTLYFQYASYRKRTELISLNTFIAGFVNIFLNYWLIPIYGYKIAAATTLFSYILLFHFANAKFVLKEHVITLKKLLPGLFFLIIISSIYFFWLANLNYLLAMPIKLVFIALSFYILLYRDNEVKN
jgi:O-antigen/teichoic acid export membrane protein